MTKHYDVLIIGAGSAGMSAAKTLKKHAVRYAIIEQAEGGTLCAKSACMPSKALIEVAHVYHQRRKFRDFGIRGADQVTADIPRVFQHVRKLRDGFVAGVLEELKDEPVIHGHARFTGNANSLQVGEDIYQADAILICTGSKSRIPEPFQNIRDRILTTDSLFEQRDLPKSMVVVGLGNSGVEMGQALARLGIEIYGVDPSDTIAGLTNPEIKRQALSVLRPDFQIDFGVEIEKADDRNGCFLLRAQDRVIETPGLLLCAGRLPNLQGLGLENTDIPQDERGVPLFDKTSLKVENHPIYIAGDANADRPILHEAVEEGQIAALYAIGKQREARQRRIPLAITFTDPPIATVGRTDDGDSMLIGKSSYANQGRAKIMGENIGEIHIYAAPDTGKLIGAQLVAPGADHMAHYLMLAIATGRTAREMLNLPYYHPVLEEGLRQALSQLMRKTGPAPAAAPQIAT